MNRKPRLIRVTASVVTVCITTLVVNLCPAQPADAAGEVPQRGRTRYIIEHVPLSLAYSGLLITVIQPGELKVEAGILMLSAGGLIAVSFAVPTTSAQAHLSVAYGYRGVLTGLGFADILRARDAASICLLGLLSGGAAEMGGYAAAKNMSAGQAHLMTTCTDLGIIGGGLLWGLTAPRDDGLSDPVPYLLAGEALGTGAGYLIPKSAGYTEGQALFIRTASVLGSAAPLGLTFALAGSDGVDFLDGRFVSGVALASGAVTTYFAERYIRGHAFTPSGGLACAGLAAAGALVGGGLGYLFAPSVEVNKTTGRFVSGLATVGALGGFAAGTAIARKSADSEGGAWVLPGGRLAMDWSAIPVAALSYAKDRQFAARNLVTFHF